MIYTKSNAARTLGQLYSRIQWVQEFWRVINVCVKGCKPTFVSKKAFKQAFVAFRKESAGAVKVKRLGFDSPYFQALGKEEIYDLALTVTGITCTCQDYKNQEDSFSLRSLKCCKHGYAVLNQLGFASLQAYIQYSR